MPLVFADTTMTDLKYRVTNWATLHGKEGISWEA